MMLLDTDVLVEIFDRGSDRGEEALESILESGEDILTTSLNLHEVLYGLGKYAKPVRDILLLPALDYTKEDAGLSARLELDAERRGIPIGRIDAMIAAISINRGARLFTFNTRHFENLTEFGLRLFRID